MIEDVAYESVAVDSHWHSLLALQKGRDQSSLGYQSKLQLLSVGAVAGILGVSQAWVRDHATRKQPHLKCVKVGKLLKFRPADVEEFIQQWCQ